MDRQKGFTMAELLTALGILSLLTAVAVPEYRTLRDESFTTISVSALTDARKALEAGKSVEEFSSAVSLWQNVPGSPTTAVGEELVPGMRVPEDSILYVYHNPNCETSSCVADYITSRHCKIKSYSLWYRLGNGSERLYDEIATTFNCP